MERHRRQPSQPPKPRGGPIARSGWLALALICVGLGSLGAFLPLLPTTPFLLVAVFAAARSSPRLHDWLYQHPRFGPLLRNWRDHRAISRRAKRNAVLLIVLSWAVTLATLSSVAVRLVVTLVLAAVIAFLLTRPTAPAAEYPD
jgi:uncharacterized membrane protein YbaN (DUF454 family)